MVAAGEFFFSDGDGLTALNFKEGEVAFGATDVTCENHGGFLRLAGGEAMLLGIKFILSATGFLG